MTEILLKALIVADFFSSLVFMVYVVKNLKAKTDEVITEQDKRMNVAMAEMRALEKETLKHYEFEEGCMTQYVHNTPHPVRVSLTSKDAEIAQSRPSWSATIKAETDPSIAVN